MNSARDGRLSNVAAPPGMGSGCAAFLPLRLSVIAGLCAALGALSAPARSTAQAGAVHALVGPAYRVLANRALAAASDPHSMTPEKQDATEKRDSVRANRPVSVSTSEQPGAAVLHEEPVIISVAMADAQRAPDANNAPDAVAGGEEDLIASIDTQSHRARLITVARNSSAVVDLRQRIDRAEIADQNIADIFVVSPTRVIVSGRNHGTTQMILWFGAQQRIFSVLVEQDLEVLNETIRRMSPTARVQTRSVNGVIVLTGTVPDGQMAQKIGEVAALYQGGEVRNQLTVAGVVQTMLRVVVAEVNKDAVRQLGFNWAIGASDWSRDFFFANNVAQLNPTVYGSNGLTNIVAPNPLGQLTYSVAATANGANTNLTFGFPRAEFQVFMQALRQNSLARILAEPNLVAISGQTATFLAGGEVPIPVSQGGAVAGSITVEYKEFGVRLAFTPTVLGGQVIRLHVMSEVSDAIESGTLPSGLPVFTFNARRVESTIECGNGQTFALAGLLNERVQAVVQKIPGIGDLPVLGSLFSSVDYQLRNTELVVLVTPELVEPLDPQQVLPPPGSEMGIPDDFQLFALGQLEGTPRPAPESRGVPRAAAPVTSPPEVAAGAWPGGQITLRGPWGFADVEEQ